MTQLVSRIRRSLSESSLLPPAFVAWRTLKGWSPALAYRNRRARAEAPLPVPPDGLIFSATGTRDVEWFLRSGNQTATALRLALDELGRPIETFDSVLDLGCGCGRVLRQWHGVEGPRFLGTDYNPKGPEWIDANLPHAAASANELAPPLPYGDTEFDLAYAISVFTHLPLDLQRAWIEELHRVLAPGSVLILTLSGEGDFGRLTRAERAEFLRGSLVVVDGHYAGTNMCGAYHPREWVERNWSDLFRVRAMYPEGARGSPRQDLYVFERVS